MVGPMIDAQNPPPGPVTQIRIGLPASMFEDVSPDRIRVGTKLFQSMLHSVTGFNETTEIVSSYRELATKLKEGKLDVGVFHGFEYAWVKDTPGLIPMQSLFPAVGSYRPALLFARTPGRRSQRI